MELKRIKFENINIDNINSVCLTLGPYRNLTSLIASIIFLHPTCQVLNHAGDRIFNIKELNFLFNYTSEKFDNFIKYAIFISQNGLRGSYGGSILLCHAFDYENIRKRYQNRYGNTLIKDKIQCLFWKESLKTQNLIKQNKVHLREIFKQNDKLKFLMPIRNPLDCAESNIRNKYMLYFPDLNEDSSFEEVLESVLKEFAWFFNMQRKYPERFLHFYENNFNKMFLLDLLNFLEIEQDSEWINNALSTFQIKKRYKHDQGKVEFYKSLLKKYFLDYPEDLKSLMLFS